MLKRTSLLIEAGRPAGSNAAGPMGVRGNIPNVASARFNGHMGEVNVKKELERRLGENRRRDRLRELVREWASRASGRKQEIVEPSSDQ